MKLLRIQAPGTPAGLGEAIGDAVAVFNDGLDIRLRFLSIWIEDSLLEVVDPESALTAVEERVTDFDPELVMLTGDGEAGVAAARAVHGRGRLLIRVGAGERAGAGADAARAMDRMAVVLIAFDDDAMRVLDEEEVQGLTLQVGLPDDPDTGGRIVRALGRARRARQGGMGC